tara:strand:- start:1817 stop:2347 length:531 start_codon:yes stop_codon:yes gene_type:complete
MARFDLTKYATVAERLVAVGKEWPDYRIETEDYSTEADRAKGVWRVKATLYLTRQDQLDRVAKATGHAFEVDGQAGANVTSGLENCESSAVGRCMALAGWSVNKDNPGSLASREEMLKVQRGPVKQQMVAVPDDFIGRVDDVSDIKQLELLWDESVRLGFSDQVKKIIADKKVVLS